jgi:hypothetical protein
VRTEALVQEGMADHARHAELREALEARVAAGAQREAGLQEAACAARLQQEGVARQLRAAEAACADAEARVEGTRAALASSTTAFMDQLGDARLCLGRTLDQAEAAETQCGALQALLAAARAKQVALEAELQQRRLLIDANSRCAAQSVAVEAALGALTAALQRVEGAAGAAGAPADAAAGAAVGTLVIDGLNQDPVLLLLAAPATAGLAPALAALASRQRTSAAAAASSAGSLLTGLRATEAEDGGAPTVEPCLSGTELPALLAACAAPASPALASLLVLAPPRGLVLLRGLSPPGHCRGRHWRAPGAGQQGARAAHAAARWRRPAPSAA